MTTEAVVIAAAREQKNQFASLLLRFASLIGKRVLQLIIVVTLIVVGTAVLVRVIPGDPARSILGLAATESSVAALREELGLNRPMFAQVLDQLTGLIVGDFGTSTQNGQPVLEVIGNGLPITFSIVLAAVLFGLVASIPIGLLPAFGLGKRGVRSIRMVMVIIMAVPSFLISLYLLIVFGVNLRWAPAGGWSSEWPETLNYIWLPGIGLGVFLVPILVRAIERQTSQLMGEEFIESAIGRGLSKFRIVVRHVLPNTLLPVITLVGYSFAVLIGGAVIIEAVYGIPGLGSVIVRAVSQRDYPVIVGVTVFTGVLTVVISMITDVLYALADPRVRNQ